MALDGGLGESCQFSLDYAWYHVGCCFLQAIVHAYFGKTENFAVAHSFALFALWMDYGLGFLVRGTRTISYPTYMGHMDDGMEALGPVGNFLFFLWFDYSAFGRY